MWRKLSDQEKQVYVKRSQVVNAVNMLAENLSPTRASGDSHFQFVHIVQPCKRCTFSDVQPLLPPCPENLSSRVCLVLDLDETLVSSDFEVYLFSSQWNCIFIFYLVCA